MNSISVWVKQVAFENLDCSRGRSRYKALFFAREDQALPEDALLWRSAWRRGADARRVRLPQGSLKDNMLEARAESGADGGWKSAAATRPKRALLLCPPRSIPRIRLSFTYAQSIPCSGSKEDLAFAQQVVQMHDAYKPVVFICHRQHRDGRLFHNVQKFSHGLPAASVSRVAAHDG